MQFQHLNYKKHACKFGNEKNCSYFEEQKACINEPLNGNENRNYSNNSNSNLRTIFLSDDSKSSYFFNFSWINDAFDS